MSEDELQIANCKMKIAKSANHIGTPRKASLPRKRRLPFCNLQSSFCNPSVFIPRLSPLRDLRASVVSLQCRL